MRIRNIFLALLLIAEFNSCKPNSDKDVIVAKFQKFKNISIKSEHKLYDTLKYNKDLFVFLEYDNASKLRKLQTVLLGHKFGHYFIFNEGGGLQGYFFLSDSVTSKIEIINSTNSANEKGSAFVDYLPVETQDTVRKYTLLFSEFPRERLQVSISTNGVKFDTVGLKSSKLMPLLLEASINTNSPRIFIRTTARDLVLPLRNINSIRYIDDTVELK